MRFFQKGLRSISRLVACPALLCLALATAAGAERVQVDITGDVDFAGCPTSFCASFPLMWGISGGESMTLRVVYDSAAPLVEDVSEPGLFFQRNYEHVLPLVSPLGVRVDFGPYSARVGGGGAVAEAYTINVFDAIDLLAFPEVGELIALTISVPPQTLTLSGPPGFHDLELKNIELDFFNVHDLFLNGAEIPAGFPGFAWENTLLAVDVYDPIYDRDGTAILDIQSLVVSTPASRSVPGLGPRGALVLATALLAVTGCFFASTRRLRAPVRAR